MISFTAKILLALLGLGVIAKNSAYFSWVWQLKEYRWDRLKSALKERPVRVWFQNAGWIKLCVLLFTLSGANMGIQIFPAYLKWGLILVLTSELYQGIRETQKKQLKKPQFTLKATVLFVLTVGTTIAIWTILGLTEGLSFLPWFISFLIAERLIAGINLFWLLTLKPPTYFYKQYLFQKARKKIDSASNLIKVGITGSYGKSTTKEILSQILGSDYNVLKTPQNTNSAIGIAKTILGKLKAKHDIFICEMGAYKKGEIEQSAEIVKPQIGILTGITNQHQALFGSLENIKEAKYELIESLPQNGLALFNGENKHCQNLKEKTEKKEAYLYGTKEGLSFKAQNIKLKPRESSFDYFTPKEQKEIELNLPGTPSIENFVGAASCAYKIGTSLEGIAQKAKNLESSLASLTLEEGKNGALVVDDGYSANPEGVKAACEYLRKAFPEEEKIIVLRTLIELGSKAKKTHQKLGKVLAESADKIYITSNEFAKTTKQAAIKAGLQENKIKIIPAPQQLINELKSSLNPKQVVLIEGRINKVISDFLLDK